MSKGQILRNRGQNRKFLETELKEPKEPTEPTELKEPENKEVV